MADPENTLADWNDTMVKRYHSEGTRFERGFLLKKIKNVAELVGTDISKTALNRAKEILTSRPEIKLVKADAQRIPISDENCINDEPINKPKT